MLLRIRKLSVIWVVISLLIYVSFVRGRYVVEVRLFGYDNPTQRCQDCRVDPLADPGCCEDFTTSTCQGNRCDSWFFYCLRTLNSPMDRSCSYFGSRQSTVNANDGALNFGQSVVLGLENPLQLQGLTDAYNGVQLHTAIQDRDLETGHDFVDFVAVNHNLFVNQTSLRRNHTGFYGFVTMDLTITVLCAQNFQGADCTECTPGFTGPNCDEVDYCFQVTCSGNGQCVGGMDSFTCSEPGGIPTSDSRILAGALGGGIAAGTLILLIPVLILTIVCVYKMLSHRELAQQSDRSNEEQLQSDANNQMTLSDDLKANEAYGNTTDYDVQDEDNVIYDEIKTNEHEATPHITTKDGNVAYGQATPHVIMEDGNVAYGQDTPHVTTTDQVAYGQATPHITTEHNVAYNQDTPHITMEDNVSYNQDTSHVTTENNVACGQINEDSLVNNLNDSDDYYY